MIMMRNHDTFDHVIAVVILLVGIAPLLLLPDLFRSWSFAVARDGIEVNGSLFNPAPRFVPWKEVTGIDVQCPAEFNWSIVVHVAGGGDAWFGTTEFHRSIAKTLDILREWRQIAAQSPTV
jgi:hypothetical protein